MPWNCHCHRGMLCWQAACFRHVCAGFRFQQPPTSFYPLRASGAHTRRPPRTRAMRLPQITTAYVNSAVEAVVSVQCVALANLQGGPAVASVGSLANDTLYTVRLVTEDTLR